MSLDDYLRRFDGHRRVTVVGPLLSGAPHPLPDESEPLIWVDGGVDHRREWGLKNPRLGFAVGDGDSARGALDQYLDADKDYSDLAYALGRLGGRFAEVVLLGFLGARRDHELFNLGEVHHFLAAPDKVTPTRVWFDRSLEAYSAGAWNLEIHGVFSLAVFATTTLQLVGACKFPLTTPTEIPALSSFGLSNQGFGEITLTTRGPAFVFKPPYNQRP